MNWNEKTPPNSLKSSAAQEETQETEKSCAAGESAPTGAKSRNRPQRFRLRCFRQNVSQLPLLYIKWESFAITMISVNHLSKVRTEKNAVGQPEKSDGAKRKPKKPQPRSAGETARDDSSVRRPDSTLKNPFACLRRASQLVKLYPKWERFSITSLSEYRSICFKM